MAKKAMIEREKKRARLVAKFAEKRAALKESRMITICQWKSVSKRV